MTNGIDCVVCADGSVSPDPCLWERNPDPMARKVEALKKQLHVEMKVKQGAENMIQMYSTSKVSRNKEPFGSMDYWIKICILSLYKNVSLIIDVGEKLISKLAFLNPSSVL